MSHSQARADLREVETRLYLQLVDEADGRSLSDAELYLLTSLQRRFRDFKKTWFKGETPTRKQPLFVANLDPASTPRLEEVMAAMERAGWEFRVTSRKIDGHRIYSAKAWREEEEGTCTALACRDPFPNVALAGAWVSADFWYRRRQNAHAARVPAMPLPQAVGQ